MTNPLPLTDANGEVRELTTIDLKNAISFSALPEDMQVVLRGRGESDLATKRDISELRRDIDVRFERIDGELKLNRWMLGILIAGVMSLVLKSFFPS